MRYAKIENNSVANGPGLRVVLWCQGCSMHCKGCHNESTWDFNAGEIFNDKAEELLFKYLEQPHIKGITFSGGHPLEKENIFEVYKIASRIKSEYPDKDIWLYTGKTFESLYLEAMLDANIEAYILAKLLNKIDVLVDGPYIEEERDITLAYRGSKNQRLVDVRKTMRKGTVVLYDVN